MCLSRLQTDEHSAQWRVIPLFHPLLSLSFHLFFCVFFSFFFFLKPCNRGGVRCVSGQVTGNDTTEESLNFSQRAGPLILQVAVSFRRQWLNIVAVFNSGAPDIFSLPPRSRSAGKTSGLLSPPVSVPDVWNVSTSATGPTFEGWRRNMLTCLQSFVVCFFCVCYLLCIINHIVLWILQMKGIIIINL